MPAIVTIKARRSTASGWTTANPVLAQGEAGLETDTNKLKYGDGTTAWSALPYFPSKLSPKTQLTSPFEKTTVTGVAPTATTIAYDIATQSDLLYDVAAASVGVTGTVNFRWDSSTALNAVMAVGDTVTVTLRITNSTNTYRPTAFQVDGTAVTQAAGTLRWQGGNAPSAANASAEDVYTFAITKTGSAAFRVLASQVMFK